MLSNKYLQKQPYDASKIFKHRKWVQRSPGLWWNVPSGLPRSHGGPNLGRRLARGQLRLCVGGPSSLVGAGEIWGTDELFGDVFGFSNVFWRKNSRQKWVWNYFLIIFPVVCLFCLEKQMAAVWEIPCPSGKEQFQWQSKSEWEYRRDRAKNMGMYWVCFHV